MKIFIDVGGYKGESVRAALDPRFGFDLVYCFEPVKALSTEISKISDRRLRVINAGLLDREVELPIYNAGTVGGSVYADAPVIVSNSTEMCSFIAASEFFRNEISMGDSVWMKLNCEGAECDIILDLIQSGQASKIREVLIDLDARKIPSASNKLDNVKLALKDAPFSFHFPEEVQYTMVTNYGGIRNWLIVTGAISRRRFDFLKSIIYQSKAALDPSLNGYYKIRLLRFVHARPPASVPTTDSALVGKQGVENHIG